MPFLDEQAMRAFLGFLAACMVVAELFLEPHIASTLNDVANHFP